jgi:hypothetical protein
MTQLKMKTISGLFTLVMLSLIFCVAIMPAEASKPKAAHDLMITSTNLSALQTEGTWKAYYGSGGELLVSQSAKDLSLPYQKSIWVNEIGAYGWQAANYKGGSYGQCVSLVSTLSKSDVAPRNWIKGREVLSGNVKPGTVIATFSGEKYNNHHAAIFSGYVPGSKVIDVWDQNWVGHSKYYDSMGLIGRHSINGTQYYVVQI